MILPDEGAAPDEQAYTVEGTLAQALDRAVELPHHGKVIVMFVSDIPGFYDVRFNAGGGISRSQIVMACQYLSALMMADLMGERQP